MAKKITNKKTTSEKITDQTATQNDILPDVCRLKHIAIDKELDGMKHNAEKRHEEIKSMIGSLQEIIKEDAKISHGNLKDKIVLTEKTIGDKIDSLSAFDDTLKGNGTPGVWESIRSLTKTVKVIMSILIIIVIFELGGSWSRINWQSLREKIWGPPQTKQIEPAEKKEEAILPPVIEKKEKESDE